MTLSDKSSKLKKYASYASIFCSVMLIVVKFIAFIKTDSLAIFSSFVDSITDFIASLVSGIAVYYAMKPATYYHRYGFGKSEALSALLQAIFVGVSGLFVVFDGINRLFNPVDVVKTEVGIYIMIFSIFSTFLLVAFQSYVAKKTNSLAIKSDMAHYVVDFLTNATVIISLVLVKNFGFIYFDVIAALFISVYLIISAYKLGKESIEQITDKELDDEIRKNIEDIVIKCCDVGGMHDLRTRSVGDIFYIELHLEIDGKISLSDAHKISDNVEEKILAIYPKSQILIHQDPVGVKEDRLDNQINGYCNII
ncbi:MAG: cation diffusion facilitator family transporter [Alphaproteobacteria bacterium]|nr:cation diffusion facilitator family transporter [Alphaproteobacteria bacterium]